MSNIEYLAGGIELLDKVEPLWNKLNAHHGEKSQYFSKRYEGFTFEARRRKFEEESTAKIRVELVKDLDKDDFVGYCISTMNKDFVGEVDSLYMSQEYRGMNIGDSLVRNSLEWLNSMGAVKKIIGVASGNEEVLEFYARFGFRVRTIILEEVPTHK